MSTALTTHVQNSLGQPTPDSAIKRRDGKGSTKFDYLPAAYVIRRLNEAFGHVWSFEVLKSEVVRGEVVGVPGTDNPVEVVALGRLSYTLGGVPGVRDQYGVQTVEYQTDYAAPKVNGKAPKSSRPVSLGQAFQGAASRALKKCAESLGIGLDLKTGGEAPEPETTADDVQSIADSIGLDEPMVIALLHAVFGKAPASIAALNAEGAKMVGAFLESVFEAQQTIVPEATPEQFAAYLIASKAPAKSAREIAAAAQAFRKGR